MARDDTFLAKNAARANQQNRAERDADHDDLKRRGACLFAGRKQRGDVGHCLGLRLQRRSVRGKKFRHRGIRAN